MNEIITSLLSGELGATSLLLLFILGILTKRFVPWWIHDDVVKKLEEYENVAPDLMDKISELIDMVDDEDREYPSRNRYNDPRALADKTHITYDRKRASTRTHSRRKPVTKRKRRNDA